MKRGIECSKRQLGFPAPLLIFVSHKKIKKEGWRISPPALNRVCNWSKTISFSLQASSLPFSSLLPS
jgi:hypothetical protein